MTLSVTQDYSAAYDWMILKNELESCGKKQLWPNLRYYGGTYMEKLIWGGGGGGIRQNTRSLCPG
jgi:hypothetical protein